MKVPEQTLRECAFARIAAIFSVQAEQLRDDTKFGEDLKSTFVSDFRYNELDQVLHDIRDVADRKIIKELNKGLLTICTVGEYCDHMVRCYETMPDEVSRILSIPQEKT
jgi:hypothetical protein